jgi:hypothetical protein
MKGVSFRNSIQLVVFATFGVCVSHGGQGSDRRLICEGSRTPAVATGIGFAPVDGSEAGGPGILFGWKAKPQGDPELAYIVLLKTPAKSEMVFKNKRSAAQKLSKGGGVVETDFILFGKRVTSKASVEWDPEKTRIANEKLMLGGKEIDLEKGRVFFLDLRAETPVYEQRKLDLPELKVPPLPGHPEVERYSKELLQALQGKPQVKEWLK